MATHSISQAMHRAVTTRSPARRSEEHTSELQSLRHLVCPAPPSFPYTTLFRSLTMGASFELLFGDANDMSDHATGGNDTMTGRADQFMIGQGPPGWLYGDAFNLSGHASGGDDTITGTEIGRAHV